MQISFFKNNKNSLLFSSLLLSSTIAYSQSDFQNCINSLQSSAINAGISNVSYTELTKGLSPDMSVLEKLDYQPEFKTPIWDYVEGLVDEDRVAQGQLLFKKYQPLLEQVSKQYGVDPYTIVAVWGVESNYGTNFGKYPLIQSLGTLSCFGRRQKYFRTEWLSTLRILQNGDIAKEQLKGSWAGAFGNTQFMPSTFEKFAIDFDGDGKRDLINSIPDALASTANFVSKSGWVNGMEWGIEVKIPKNIEPEGRHAKHDVIYWKNKGVTLINGASLPSDLTKSGLLTIAGVDGPAFLVTKNFDAIYRYNAAESYALAISHLSDRLRGYNHFITPWPTDDAPLTFTQKKELQSLLMLKGYNIGEIDGRFGEKSRIAIKSEQLKLGQEQSGRAGQKLFATLNNK